MGYAATTNVVYGIELEPSCIEDFLTDLENIMLLHGCPDFDILSTPHHKLMPLCEKYLGLSEFVMRGEDADSRAQHTAWYSHDDRSLKCSQT